MPLEAAEKYDGKSVLLQVEVRGRLVTMQGVFRVLGASGVEVAYVSIDDLRAGDPSLDASMTGCRIHLSQEHVDSISPSNDAQRVIEFVVGLAFYARHYIQDS